MSGAPHILCAALAVGWLGLAAAIGLAPVAWRGRLLGLAIASGVPLIGLLTYRWGPGPGVLGLALGIVVLRRLPQAMRRAAAGRRAPAVAEAGRT